MIHKSEFILDEIVRLGQVDDRAITIRGNIEITSREARKFAQWLKNAAQYLDDQVPKKDE